jgi:DNA-binding response OmpR family regulator
MALAIKRIMLVTRNVQFAIDVKRALEALGEYSVTAVADIRNAVEQLSEHPHNLVLLDTANLSISPAIMIEVMRARRAGIAVVLAPDSPETHELARTFEAQGVVDIPVMARDLVPVLDAALRIEEDPLPPTQESLAIDVGEDTVYIESLVDDILEEDLALNYTRRRLQASYELLHPSIDSAERHTTKSAVEVLVERDEEGDTVLYRYVTPEDDGQATTTSLEADIAQETPLAPSAGSETVRDLRNAITGERDGTAGAQAKPSSASEAAYPDDSDAFEVMLNAVLEESTQLENLTLESLFDTTRELPGALGTGVVPAWLRETEKFIREPGFLAEMADKLPPMTEPPVAGGETTMPAESSVGAVEVAAVEREIRADETDEASAADLAPQPETDEPPLHDPYSTPLWSRDDDPLLAQLAVTVTQMMTELTADATVLTRDNRIVAFSGEMPLEDFRALRRIIGDDWAANGNQSRIRFVKQPESALDCMLYSRGSIGDFTLTMVFAGGRQLRDIRRQGDRMLRALDSSPVGDMAAAETELGAPPAAEVARQPFAIVWLVDDPARLLQRPVAEQLVFWLEVQLNSLNWQIKRLDVHHDFIYLCADVPAQASPDALVRTVMDRARQIACSEDRSLPQDLWADAYLVLQPGRDMSDRELQRFLQFARA